MIHQSLTWYDHQQMIILPVILSSNYVDIQQHFQNRLCFQIPTKINRHIVANKKKSEKNDTKHSFEKKLTCSKSLSNKTGSSI